MRVWERLGWAAAISLSCVAVWGCAAIAGARLNNNFHPVVSGEVYRSAQPNAAQLTEYRDAYGIRSVINLRGIAPRAHWYRQEVTQSEALGLNHYDFPMSARHELTAEQARQLATLMRDAPKPLLIHCKAGSDRTGLAAALYLAADAGVSEEQAESQLSIAYGHIGLPFLGAWQMNETFEKMEAALGFTGS